MRKVFVFLVCAVACPALGQGRRAARNDNVVGPPAPASVRRAAPPRKPPEVQEAEREVFQAIREINDDAKKIGPWKQQSDIIVNATNRIFQRNGWNNPTDHFARQISTEVTKIPPWDATARFNKLVELMAKRYRLDETQKKQLRAMLAWESFNFFMKHAPDLLDQSREMLGTRARREPFSREQIARWSKAGKPLMQEWQKRLSGISERMRPRMRPDQIKAIGADLRAWDQRTQDISHLMDRWAQGDWEPADWGLDADPIHAAARLASNDERPIPEPQPQEEPAPVEGPARPAPRDPLFDVSQNEDEWERYVHQFITRYKLDNTQRTSALSILEQLYDRAAQMRENRVDQLDQIDRLIKNADDPETKKRYTKDKEDVLAPIRMLFDELKSRLDTLPTEAQRRAAGTRAGAKAGAK